MSALDFPLEVTAMMMKKLRLVDHLRLYSVRSEFFELRYEKSLEKAMGNITQSQLCQLYAESKKTNQKNLYFHEQVMDRLEIDTFNEVVHLYMKTKNDAFFSTNKILKSYGKEIILVEEPDMPYASDFWSCCKNLLEKIEGEIFLVLVDVDERQLWDGNDGINFRSRVKYFVKLGGTTADMFPNLIFQFITAKYNYGGNSYDSLIIENPHNGVDTTRYIISIMKSNVLQGARKILESALPIIQARLLLDNIDCNSCGTDSYRRGNRVFISRYSLRRLRTWPMCVHCVI